MSEQYRKIYALSQEACAPQSDIPITIIAGALLIHNRQGKPLIQVKYQNTAQKVIQSMTVKFRLYDDSIAKAEKIHNFEYENIGANSDQTFGDNIPVPLEDKAATSFSCEVIKITYRDGSHWSSVAEETKVIAKEVATTAVHATKKTASFAWKIVSFIINTLVFLAFLLFLMTGVRSDSSKYILETGALDPRYIVMMVSLTICTISSFPIWGIILAKRPDGLKLRIIRWGIVIGVLLVLIGLLYLLNFVFI